MPTQIGTVDAYRAYRLAADELQKSGKRCELQLTPQLIGLERKRVEVIDKYGETRRFYVGKSTGFVPIHLEIKLRTSRGGSAVTGAPFKSVRIVGGTMKSLAVPGDFPVKVLRTVKQRAKAKDVATCGTCGRSWDDGKSTGWTPTPSGRCPFEYFHAEE